MVKQPPLDLWHIKRDLSQCNVLEFPLLPIDYNWEYTLPSEAPEVPQESNSGKVLIEGDLSLTFFFNNVPERFSDLHVPPSSEL